MSMDPLSVRQAIEGFNDGSLAGSMLMRALIAHVPWRLPAIVDDDGTMRVRLVQLDDDVCLDVFTDDEAWRAYRDDGMAEAQTTVVETTFAPVLESLEAPVTHLRVNPSSADALLYDAEQFGLFGELAAAGSVEEVLSGTVACADAMAVVREYCGFWVAAHQEDDARHTMLVPGDDGRMLLAVFTARDCLDLFLLDHEDLLEEPPERVRLDGAELLELIRDLPIEGIVFNAAGPVEPRAFDLADAPDGAMAQVGEA